MKQYHSPEEAKQDQLYLEALTELLFQLADDDLLIAQRGAEWLGLGPHIEEDVAFASITQDCLTLMVFRQLHVVFLKLK